MNQPDDPGIDFRGRKPKRDPLAVIVVAAVVVLLFIYCLVVGV